MTDQPTGAASRTRLDPEPVDPRWPVPSSPAEQVPAGRRRKLTVTLAAILALLVVGGLLWWTGAFAQRTDRATPVPAGSTITTGPFELTFSTVTVQKRKDSISDKVEWKVRAIGSGRTTGDESLAPSTFATSGMFVSRDEATGQIQRPSGDRWGREERIGDGSAFTPGLPAVPYVVEFTYPATYQPQATLAFGVFEQQFSDRSLLGDQKKTWHNADGYFLYRLPVTRLPDDLD